MTATSRQKNIYTFIGLPASGKDTQAKELALDLKTTVWGVGDLIREQISKNKDDIFIQQIERRYDKGVPQPDHVAIELVKRKLEQADRDVVLSNFPFTLAQADFMTENITKLGFAQLVIIYIKVSPETSFARATSRRVCLECGAIYPISHKGDHCKCGAMLQTRTDDDAKTVQKRITDYQKEIEIVTAYYRKKGSLIEIDGEKTIEAVRKEILAKI
ncbi:MAG: nucleoside monophosphate kinase [Candidatus Berkelbacteria bacterium]